MSNEIANSGEILLYSYEGSKTYIDVYFRDETFWLTQSGIAELFNCSSDNISHEDAVKKGQRGLCRVPQEAGRGLCFGV